MQSYDLYCRIKENINKRLWRFLFGGNLRKMGNNSWIISPRKIIGARHMTLGDNVYIQDQAYLVAVKIGPEDPILHIGDGAVIGNYLHITSVRKVYLEKDVLIADRVFITDNMHGFEDISRPIHEQPLRFKAEVTIGAGTWLGENVCILGSSIGRHCVVAANSVVTRDIPDFSVVAGSPAKVIKRYNPVSKGWEPVK